MKYKIALASVIVLVIIQFIPFAKNQDTDDSYGFMQFYQLSEKHEVHSLLKTSCYDCHSNNTKYPWYSKVAPVSWYLENHVRGGKKHLNFSEWKYLEDGEKAHKIEECIEMIEEKEMPLKSYLLIHDEAKLSETQRQTLIAFFKSL